MREIKFRAWDKQDKVYFLNALPVPNGIEYSFNYDGHVLIEITDRYIFQEYTGLKDKNGVEIYEGDIFEDGEDGSINWVEYDAAHAGFTTTDGKHGGWWDARDFAIFAPKYQIIGNIYENPELVK